MEEEARGYPKVERILQKYANIPQVTCHHYGEIFNINDPTFKACQRLIKESKPRVEEFIYNSSKKHYK